MVNEESLKQRINELSAHLIDIEKRFHETRDRLKTLKKEINDTKWAIAEIEKLLIEISQ